MCVLEALGSGLPVASTNVGEVARAVKPGVNGELVSTHDTKSLAEAISRCRANIASYRGAPCLAAIQEFKPQIVLERVYENYRRLAAVKP
jgi:glycosyltransferase involved in cell wall biosynthesis